MPDLARAAAALRKAATVTARKVGGNSYAATRLDYRESLADAAKAFLDGDTRNSTLRQATSSLLNNYTLAAIQGFQEGAEDKGASLEAADEQFLRQAQANEAAFLSGLWTDLEQLRKDGKKQVPQNRIDGFVNSLDGLFNEMKLRGAAATVLEFTGNDGQESCPDCRKMKGKKHKASWWTSNNLVPGIPGTEAYACRGFRCEHFLVDRRGKRFTV